MEFGVGCWYPFLDNCDVCVLEYVFVDLVCCCWCSPGGSWVAWVPSFDFESKYRVVCAYVAFCFFNSVCDIMWVWTDGSGVHDPVWVVVYCHWVLFRVWVCELYVLSVFGSFVGFLWWWSAVLVV